MIGLVVGIVAALEFVNRSHELEADRALHIDRSQPVQGWAVVESAGIWAFDLLAQVDEDLPEVRGHRRGLLGHRPDPLLVLTEHVPGRGEESHSEYVVTPREDREPFPLMGRVNLEHVLNVRVPHRVGDGAIREEWGGLHLQVQAALEAPEKTLH